MSQETDPLEADVKFIFSECARLRQPDAYKGIVPNSPQAMEFFYEIPTGDDRNRRVPCGRVANERLLRLCRIAAERHGISRTCSLETIKAILGPALWRRFVTNNEPIEGSRIEGALDEAARAAAQDLQPSIHFIPCHLMANDTPPEFNIGGVSFLSKKAFRRELRRQITHEDRENVDADPLMFRYANAYYRAFRWVIRIELVPCDKMMAERLASKAASSALDAVQIIFGAPATYNMTLGGPAVPHKRRASYSIFGSKLQVMNSVGGMGSFGFPDDWHELLDQPDYSMIRHLFGTALECRTDPTLTRPMSERFLDAAHWYGEAVRDRDAATKIVKYATALERLLMTEERQGISRTVSIRAAAFCSDPGVRVSRQEAYDDARRLYALRSELVHGSKSPHAEDLVNGVRSGADLAQRALINFLSLLDVEGLCSGDVTKAALAKWFSDFVVHTNQFFPPLDQDRWRTDSGNGALNSNSH